MNQFAVIARVQLRGVLATLTGSQKKVRRAAPLLLVIAAFSAYMGLAYAFGLAQALGGDADLVLVLMPALGVLAAVALGGQGVAGFTFGGKDTDLLLGLPVPRMTLALAKQAAVFVENALVLLVMVLSAGIAYAWRTPVGAAFWVALVVGALLLSLLATTLALVVGTGVVLLRTGRRQVAANLGGLVLVLGILVLALVGQSALAERLMADAGGVRDLLATWAAPFSWLRDAAVDGSLPALARLAAACVVPFVVVTWGVSRAFVPITSALAVRRGPARRVDLAGMRVRTPFVALLRREGQRFVASSVYLLNCGVGPAFMLLAAAWVGAVGLPAPMLEGARAAGLSPVLLVALVLAFMGTVGSTTPASVSLEGNRLWILRSAPVPAGTVLAAKVVFALALTLVPLTVATLVVGLRLGLDPLLTLLVGGLPAVAAVVMAEVGLLAGLRWARLDAPSETAIVKQGPAALVSTFGSMALVGVLALGTLALAPMAGVEVALAVPTLALALVAVVLAGLSGRGAYGRSQRCERRASAGDLGRLGGPGATDTRGEGRR